MSGSSLDGIDVRSVWQLLQPQLVRTTFISSERLDRAIGSGKRVALVGQNQ